MGEYEVGMITNKIIHQANPAITQGQDPSLIPRNLKMSTINEKELDPTIQDKLKTLNNAKTKAVENDDFDKAKTLKDVKIAGN
jgi:hypothetical protein